MADNGTPISSTSIEELVGHVDGEVLPSGEVVVYDYDEDGQYTGWHKAPNNN